MSVGGVRDESEIRGHRRTYIGSMPGTIIRSLRDAESSNPLLLIDEIDKMGSDWRGDPSTAMLEVLDPEQNKCFRDHYLDLPFDLSKVLFICTANTTDTIPGAAARPDGRDRADRLHRGREARDRQALPAAEAARTRTASSARSSTLSDTMLRTIIREYTREAGVRNLERRLADVCRKAAAQVAKGKTQKTRVDDRRAARVARPAAVLGRGAQAHVRARRRDGARLHRGRRRRALHRGGRVPGQGQPDGDRPARRRDAGVGARGALVGALARRQARRRPRTGSRSTTSTSTSRPARCRRTARRPA